MRSWARVVGVTVVAVVAALITAILSAPASWVDAALRQATHDRARLADARGSFWRGEGRLVLLDGSAGSEVADGFALPGVLSWQLSGVALLTGAVDATLSLTGMASPVHVIGRWSHWRIEAGAMDLPSVELSRLGSPWNTIRPSALLGLRWDAIEWRREATNGRLSIELRDVASAMTPVHPLGTYRIDVVASGPDVNLTLTTVRGALQLQGDGRWERRAGLRFTAQARAEASERARLQPLLGLIGRREGDRTTIKIGG